MPYNIKASRKKWGLVTALAQLHLDYTRERRGLTFCLDWQLMQG